MSQYRQAPGMGGGYQYDDDEDEAYPPQSFGGPMPSQVGGLSAAPSYVSANQFAARLQQAQSSLPPTPPPALHRQRKQSAAMQQQRYQSVEDQESYRDDGPPLPPRDREPSRASPEQPSLMDVLRSALPAMRDQLRPDSEGGSTVYGERRIPSQYRPPGKPRSVKPPVSYSKPESERYDSRQYDPRQYDSRQYDSQQYDSRQYDSQQYDSRQYDSRQYDEPEPEYSPPKPFVPKPPPPQFLPKSSMDRRAFAPPPKPEPMVVRNNAEPSTRYFRNQFRATNAMVSFRPSPALGGGGNMPQPRARAPTLPSRQRAMTNGSQSTVRTRQKTPIRLMGQSNRMESRDLARDMAQEVASKAPSKISSYQSSNYPKSSNEVSSKPTLPAPRRPFITELTKKTGGPQYRPPTPDNAAISYRPSPALLGARSAEPPSFKPTFQNVPESAPKVPSRRRSPVSDVPARRSRSLDYSEYKRSPSPEMRRRSPSPEMRRRSPSPEMRRQTPEYIPPTFSNYASPSNARQVDQNGFVSFRPSPALAYLGKPKETTTTEDYSQPYNYKAQGSGTLKYAEILSKLKPSPRPVTMSPGAANNVVKRPATKIKSRRPTATKSKVKSKAKVPPTSSSIERDQARIRELEKQLDEYYKQLGQEPVYQKQSLARSTKPEKARDGIGTVAYKNVKSNLKATKLHESTTSRMKSRATKQSENSKASRATKRSQKPRIIRRVPTDAKSMASGKTRRTKKKTLKVWTLKNGKWMLRPANDKRETREENIPKPDVSRDLSPTNWDRSKTGHWVIPNSRKNIPSTDRYSVNRFRGVKVKTTRVTKPVGWVGIPKANDVKNDPPTRFVKKKTESSKPKPKSTKPMESRSVASKIKKPGQTIKGSNFGEKISANLLREKIGLAADRAEKYEKIFRLEGIDQAALFLVTDSDLKDLGIAMGPRKKILAYVSKHR